MSLKKYYNTKVNIITNTGKKFDGVVTDYFHPDENETGKESIVIDSSNGSAIEFYEDDIKEIEVEDAPFLTGHSSTTFCIF